MTAHDLKPCPFCGGEARIETVNHDYGVTYSVGCFGSGRCGASFTLFDHRNDAIATWNRRTQADEDPHNVMHVYEGDGGVIIRENGNVSSFGVQSAEVQAAFAAATAAVPADIAALVERMDRRSDEMEALSDVAMAARSEALLAEVKARSARRLATIGLPPTPSPLLMRHVRTLLNGERKG